MFVRRFERNIHALDPSSSMAPLRRAIALTHRSHRRSDGFEIMRVWVEFKGCAAWRGVGDSADNWETHKKDGDGYMYGLTAKWNSDIFSGVLEGGSYKTYESELIFYIKNSIEYNLIICDWLADNFDSRFLEQQNIRTQLRTQIMDVKQEQNFYFPDQTFLSDQVYCLLRPPYYYCAHHHFPFPSLP